MTHPARTATSVASVLPTAAASSSLRPVSASDVSVTGGFWADRLATNRERTIPAGFEQLQGTGTLHNFSLAAGSAAAGDGYRAVGIMFDKPFPFLDSDVYKWLEGAGWELGRSHDPEIGVMADEAIGLVQAAQRPDGYLNTFVQVLAPGTEYQDLQWGHELYCLGHLIQAAIAWHRALGDDRLLLVAERAVASVERELGPAGRIGIDGHPRDRDGAGGALSGDRRAPLPRSRRIVHRAARARAAGQRPLRSGVLAGPPAGRRGAVRGRPCGSPALPRLRRRRRGGRARRSRPAGRGHAPLARHGRDADVPHGRPRQPPQGRGVRRSVRAATGPGLRRDLRGDRLGHARLAVSAGHRRARVRGRHRADALQRGAAGTVGRWHGVLLRQPAPAPDRARVVGARRWTAGPVVRLRVLPTQSDADDRVDAQPRRDDRPGRHPDPPVRDGRRSRADVPGGQARVALATDYPWNGRVEVTVLETPDDPWTLDLRIPGWASGATFRGPDGEAARTEASTVGETRSWRVGDSVTLELEMSARVTEPHPRIDAVRGCVALERGPLVYCLETADLPSGSVLEDVSVDPGVSPIPGPRPDLDDGVVGLTLPARGGSSALEVAAIPYYAWGNRSADAMRVWIPTTRS